MDTLIKGGYSIFVVRGDFPPIFPQPSEPNWVEFINQPNSNSSQSQEDEELQRAISASLGQEFVFMIKFCIL